MRFVLFLVAGGVSGLITAFALDLKSPKELTQGVMGGMIAALFLSLMLPY